MPVFIIAEAGVNHNGDAGLALKLIDAAKDAGADAVKFQTFIADKLVTKSAAKAGYQTRNTGSVESQYEMLSRLELTPESHRELMDHCRMVGILFLSTPFDFESADLLESLEVGMYKIGSGDLTNLPLLRHVAGKGKPVILSTGMSSLGEVEEGLNAVYSVGNRNVSLLHCTTNYPAPYGEVNLRAMLTLREAFKVEVGYSDHTEGMEVSLAAVALGATIIEKHFTLDRSLPGPDHRASLEPGELARMVTGIRNIEKAMGDGVKVMTESERAIREIARKSVVAGKDIQKGSIIGKKDLDIKRPTGGIEPKFYEDVAGRVARRDIRADTVLQWSDLE